MSKIQSKPSRNPTPALPLSGEGADRAKVQSLSGKEATPQKVEALRKTQIIAHSAPPPDKGEAGRGLKPQLHNLKSQENKRRQLRKNQTEPEKRFWSWVRGKQLGTKFRRQHGIGAYIVDFYCAELGLIVEIDGDSHYTENAKQLDDERTAFLQSKGFQVIRFTNLDVMQNKNGVLQTVAGCLKQRREVNK
ncbi:MAG: endonuclease domain-containing protein [Methylococcaceae bacterium]|nr:endonuclease domain-containing protein [Methylococcaceae bacterium]